MAHGHGTRLLLEGLLAYRTVDYDRDPGAIDNLGDETPTDAQSANAGPAHLADAIASPFAGLVTDAGIDGLGIGVGVYVPFGGQASWDKNEAYEGNTTYPGAVDGTQRWAAIEGSQRALYYTLAGAYRTRDGRFSIGAGINLVQQEVSLVRARNANGTDDLVTGMTLVEGRSLLEVDGMDLAASAGIIVKPTPCSRIGVSYQSQPNFGESRLEGTLTNKFGATAPAPVDVYLTQSLPDIVRVAGEWRAFPNASLHAAADYQRWSSYDNQCIIAASSPDAKCDILPTGAAGPEGTGILVNIPRRYKDSFGARLGGRYYASDTLEINGGLSFDSNAVPDDTMDPSLFDMNKVIGQAGVAWTSKTVNLSLSVAHVYYNPRTTSPRATDPAAPSRNPDMAGEYKSQVTFAILGVGVHL